MSHIDARIAQLLSLPFYSRELGAWRGKPRRRWVKPDVNGCLNFQGATNSKGYGCVGEGLVHRLAWVAFKGTIPEGWEIHHLCKNKLCCNIDHLDCLTKREHAALEARPQKLDEARVIDMLDMLAAGASRAEVALRFGVSKTTVTEIRRGRAWRPVVAAFNARTAATVGHLAA